MKRAATAIAAVFLCVLICAASASAQSVVVNKYFNSGTTADIVELLVIQDGLDMRGMFIKDFSSSMVNDGGGKYQFSNDALWSAVPAGTLIVLRNNNSAADVTVGGGDFNIDVGMQNTVYFTNAGGTFDIATTEMVMIKTVASGAAGVAGNIHTLAGGTAGAQFTSTADPKLRSTGTSGTNQFVFANNSTQSINDFNGTDATGAATGLTFGAGNNANNTAYINSLRVVGPASEPTVQASNVLFSNINATSMTVSWTNGNGQSRIVLAKQGAPVDAAPVDGTAYTANAAFGSGTQLGPVSSASTSKTIKPVVTSTTTKPTATSTTITKTVARPTKSGSKFTTTLSSSSSVATAVSSSLPVTAVADTGNYVVFAGAGNSVTVTNLQPSTTYHFAVFEFNGANTGTNYLVTSPATGSQATAASFAISGAVRTQGGAGISGVTLTLSSGDTALANAVTDSSGNYSFPTVTAGGDYTVTPSSTSFTFSPASASFTGLASNQTADFTAIPRIIISEFRFRGTDPDGAGAQTASANEFVELYNQTDENVTVTGWTLRASTGTTLLTLPAVIIPARGHYLVGGTSYGLAAYAAANSVLAADIPDGAGVALFNNSVTFDLGTRLDAAGFSGVGDVTYREGAGLTPAGGVTSDGETSFVRRVVGGLPADGDDNEADFLFVATDGGIYDSRQSGLGAPGPENTSSPVNRNAAVSLVLLDPAVSSSQPPNRTRDFTSEPANNSTFGTMSIRRTLTNNTGANITRLRFRIINMTTYPAPSGLADLRARTSGSASVTVTGGAMKTVLGTTLEEPPAQPNGGGNNSTLAAGTVTLAQPLANGASIDLQFLVGIQQTGTFRFFLNVEAVTQAPPSASVHLTMGNPSNATADVNQPTNYLMEKPQFVLSYHRDRGTAIWTSWHLDSTWLGSTPRQDDFRADTSLPAGWYQVQSTDFSGSGFDRGHMTPSADRTKTVADNSATFLMTNMIPQAPDNNQGPWANMENFLRTLVTAGNELYVISGGSGTGGSGSGGGTTNTIAGGKVTVPSQTWKVVIVIPSGTDDVSRVTNQTRTIAVIMPNTQGIRTTDWKTFRVSVDQVEALTGFDFFSNVPVATQAAIESVVDNQ
jgi:endonuclease G, mitochondrial